MARAFTLGRFRARPRSGKGYEYRVTDSMGLTVAVSRTPENARLVYEALTAFYAQQSDDQPRRSMSGDEMWRDNNA